MRFRLAPTSVTLDALERRKGPARQNKQNSGAHQKNFNEDRPILLAVKCRIVIVVSRNIRYSVYVDMYRLLPRDATQSAVMRLHVVCPSV